MSKAEKLLKRLSSRPKDFTYNELVTLLNQLGYGELKQGKTGGSRRAFVHHTTKQIIRLHKPHPGRILKMYQIDLIIINLTENGLL